MIEMMGMMREGKSMADYPYLDDYAKPMLDELVWWANTLKEGRSPRQPEFWCTAGSAKVGYYCADPGIWLRSRRLSVFQCLSFATGTRNTRLLRLVEQAIPLLGA
jgi:hypothetical protein